MDSNNYLIDLFEKKMTEKLSSLGAPKTLYEPIAYSLRTGGKRIRPLLTLIAAQLFSEDYEKAMPSALALEIFHNFTLLHDDIIDNSKTRRGQPSVMNKFGLSQAILSGDAMLVLATYCLQESDKHFFPSLFDTYSNMAVHIMEGQQYDIDYEKMSHVVLEDYIKMVTYKTAVLFATALEMGAVSVGASKKDAEMLYDSGINIGIAFQLRDDFLDVYGNDQTFGKPIGNDIVENKKTWLYIKAEEISCQRGDRRWKEYLEITDKRLKIDRVKSLFDDYNLVRFGNDLIEDYTEKALKILDNLSEVRKLPCKELKRLFLTLAGREA